MTLGYVLSMLFGVRTYTICTITMVMIVYSHEYKVLEVSASDFGYHILELF